MKVQSIKSEKAVKTLTTKQLIEIFIMTAEKYDENWELISTVRSWIMDELELRNPEAFDRWLDSDEPDARDLPKFFFGKEG